MALPAERRIVAGGFVKRLALLSLLAGSILCAGHLAQAQISGARIDGIIRDPQSLPLPGVQVVLAEVRTGLTRTTQTTARPYGFTIQCVPFSKGTSFSTQL